MFIKPPKFEVIVPFTSNNLNEKDSWMWGQYNRIFPFKLALRCLSIKLKSNEWIDLDEFKEETAEIAQQFSEIIKKYENENNLKKQDKISAGLPIKSDDFYQELSSLTRFKEHFIGYVRKNDLKLSGALPFLRFVNINKGEKGKHLIGFTEEGYNFSKINNPIIDNKIFNISLSEQEIDFYLSHISQNVIGELKAIVWVLNKLSKGIFERTGLNNELKKDFNNIWNVSDKVINTQRAGLMARMFELKLYKKTRKGIRVHYYISEKGETYLKKYSKLEINNK